MINKEQQRAYYRAYYLAHRDRILARMSVYSKSHREQENAYRRSYRRIPENAAKINATRRRYRNRSTKELDDLRKRRYGITPSDFNALLAKQGGVCAICKTADWGHRKHHLDHHHKSKVVRGILCNKCNLAIGLINDDPKIARAMARYLIQTAFTLAILNDEKEGER